MTPRQTTISIPNCAPAALILPVPLTAESIGQLEAAIGSLFRTLRGDLRGSATDDPGAVEFDSWRVHLH